MEILGVGGAELVVILIIMLIVAGPKRMIRWAYVLGTYVSKLRSMWAESMKVIEQEMKQAGMDIELPKEPPTRSSINKSLANALKPVSQPLDEVAKEITKPMQQALDETSSQINQIKQNAAINESNGASSPPPNNSQPNFGTWSGGEKSDT
jgi:Sec-independent protein translocase protein TatA